MHLPRSTRGTREIVLSTLELKHATLATLYQAARARALTIICNGTPEPAGWP